MIEYGAVWSSGPQFAPFSLNCTPTTPTSSVVLAKTVTFPRTKIPQGSSTIMTTSAGFTMIATSSDAESAPSVAVNRSVYVPGVVKLAIVFRAFTFENDTGPGPLTILQNTVTVLP